MMKLFVLLGILFVSALAAAMPAEVAPPPAEYYSQRLSWTLRGTIENYNTATWTYRFNDDHRISSNTLTHVAGIATVEISGGVGFNWISIRVVQPNFIGPLYSYRFEISGYRFDTDSTYQEISATKLVSDGEENVFFVKEVKFD